MKIPKLNTRRIDVDELAMLVLGLNPNDDASHDADLDDLLNDKFEVGFEQFEQIVAALMPYTVLTKSPLSENLRIGFVNHEENTYIVKVEFETQEQ